MSSATSSVEQDSNEMMVGSSAGASVDGAAEENSEGAVTRSARGPRWTAEEDEHVRQLVDRHGAVNWKLISEELKTGRTADQCLSRWNKVRAHIEQQLLYRSCKLFFCLVVLYKRREPNEL